MAHWLRPVERTLWSNVKTTYCDCWKKYSELRNISQMKVVEQKVQQSSLIWSEVEACISKKWKYSSTSIAYLNSRVSVIHFTTADNLRQPLLARAKYEAW